MAGSLRRMRATIGDIDLVAAVDDPLPIMQAFVDHPLIEKVTMQGAVKTSVELRNGLRAQLWIHPPKEWGTALQYATGSKEHSVRLRELAVVRGCSLSDHSIILEDGQELFLPTEEGVYEFFDMQWVPPELREDRGEIQAALEHQLPHLIELKDIRGDLHNHSTWSDGTVSIKAMAEAARDRGYIYIGITDHTGSLGIVQGMKPEDVKKQREEIDKVQADLGDSIRILQGAEVEILSDGSLDYPDEVLASLDIVFASLHSGLRQPRDVVTSRLIKAMRNKNVDVIGHPTGRLIPNREGADLDMEAILKVAQETGIALEINAHPSRLDLEDIYARRAVEMGIPLCINTDAHAPDGLDMMFYGVATARRGWVEPHNVLNTWKIDKLEKWLKARS
jgi:DNA polymerase (family 10)